VASNPVDSAAFRAQTVRVALEVGQLKADNMSKMKETYAALAIEPDNVRYGWMRM